MGNSETRQQLVISSSPKIDYEDAEAVYLFGRKSFDTTKLMATFASAVLARGHINKKIVYEIACGTKDKPAYSPHQGTLVYSRWRAIPLLPTYPADYPTEFEQREDAFDYQPTSLSTSTNDPIVEWHVNFADSNLFVAYTGSLFAQDEIQVAEMPSLGHLKDALIHHCQAAPEFHPVTRLDAQPTPILIRGIERRCSVATDSNSSQGRPRGLYGNAFGAADPEVVKKATKAILTPQVVNLIAMAALGGGHGEYTLPQIVDTFTTAYTSFLAAKLESQLAVNGESFPFKQKAKVIVHTGNWGTGAFGGNKALMTALQLAAAQMAGVDKLVYHTFNKEGTDGYKAGYNLLMKEFSKSMPTEEFLKALEAKKFRWGVSDGN